MAAVFSFLTGALNAREKDIDEDKKHMDDNEKWMRQSLLSEGPKVAQSKALAVEYKNRYDQAIAAKLDPFYAAQYAQDQKLGADFLINMRNPGTPSSVNTQTNTALGQPTPTINPISATTPGGTLPDGASAGSQGQAAFNQTSGQDTGQATQQAAAIGNAGTSLSGVAQTAAAVQPTTTPAGTTPPGTTLGQPNNPDAHIDPSRAYNPKSSLSFRDILFGNIPDDVQAGAAYEHIAQSTGMTPQQVQQQLNSIMTGDYIFRPEQVTGPISAPSYIPNVPNEKVQEEVDRFLSGHQFMSHENQSKAMDLVQRGYAERNPDLIRQALALTATAPEIGSTRVHAQTGKGGFTANQINNDMVRGISSVWGVPAPSVFNFAPDGSQLENVTLGVGQNANLNAGANASIGLAQQMLIEKYGSLQDVPAGEARRVGNIASAYIAHEQITHNGPTMPDGTANPNYNILRDVHNRTGVEHFSSNDLMWAANARSNQVIFDPKDADVVHKMEVAKQTGDTDIGSALAREYPDVYTKFVQDWNIKHPAVGPKNSDSSPVKQTQEQHYAEQNKEKVHLGRNDAPNPKDRFDAQPTKPTKQEEYYKKKNK